MSMDTLEIAIRETQHNTNGLLQHEKSINGDLEKESSQILAGCSFLESSIFLASAT